VEARGLASGFFQEGYAVGYLIPAVNNLFIMPEVKQGCRALFWFSVDLSLSAAKITALLLESEVLLKAMATEVEKGHITTRKTEFSSMRRGYVERPLSHVKVTLFLPAPFISLFFFFITEIHFSNDIIF